MRGVSARNLSVRWLGAVGGGANPAGRRVAHIGLLREGTGN